VQTFVNSVMDAPKSDGCVMDEIPSITGQCIYSQWYIRYRDGVMDGFVFLSFVAAVFLYNLQLVNSFYNL